MANEKQKNIVACYIFVLVASMHILDNRVVEGRLVHVQKYLHLKKPKGTIKTIESDDGDVIDCVDIYSQHGFDNNQHIKNILMRPSSYPSGMKPEDSLPELIQVWHKNGECPEGTIPIRRTPNHNQQRKYFPFPSHGTQLNHSILGEDFKHEYAAVGVSGSVYYGAHALVNVWNPKTEKKEFSLSQIWVVSKTSDIATTNSIEAGWIVFPGKYGDNRTRFFIYWTRDNYQKTGCYDLGCSGFVQVNRKFAVGSALKPVSTYKRKTFDVSITIFKDKSTGNWWLNLQGVEIGYWPRAIFTGLADNATNLSWGGEIINARSAGRHTTTRMGSGHFSREGYRKASLFRDLGVVDGSNTRKDPDPAQVDLYVTNPACYDLRIRREKPTYFYYGGPGYSRSRCP